MPSFLTKAPVHHPMGSGNLDGHLISRTMQTRQQELLQERCQQEEKLLQALASPMGSYKDKPMAALVVFRACLKWRSYQADRTSVFDRIIQVIDSELEWHQDDNACLAYWLTNTVTLLQLLQRNIKPTSGLSAAARRNDMYGLFGRQPTAGEASIHGGGVGDSRPVVAKYPALLFKQQVEASVQKIFPMMRDNVKKNITPMLNQCIHMPPKAHSSDTAEQNKGLSDILQVFDKVLTKLKDNHVPRPLVQALFKQLFSFVNVQMFNQLLMRRQCCSFSNGEYIKAGLAQVKSWIMEHGVEWVGESWEELKFIRQAVTFLVTPDKSKKTFDDITRDLCPLLSSVQLYRISTMYRDDNCNTDTVSSEVLGRMKQAKDELMKQALPEPSSRTSQCFLLDDDSKLPFVANEIAARMDDKDLYVALPVPESLRDNAGSFGFLEMELRFSQM